MKRPVKCLLIDDDADDKEFFLLALKDIEKKVDFHYSCTAKDALEKLESGEYKPDYIFLDMNMRPVDGLECLQSIKGISKVVDVPVIIYSTSINEKLKYQTLESGAFDHFKKPSTVCDLVEYLKRILQLEA